MKRAVRELGIAGRKKGKGTADGDVSTDGVQDVDQDVSRAELDKGRIEDVTDEVEYANPIPTNEQGVVLGNGDMLSEEGRPADEAVREIQDNDEGANGMLENGQLPDSTDAANDDLQRLESESG